MFVIERTSNVCTDSYDIPILINPLKNATGFILKPGSACANTQGYCDIFSKCRAVDAEGPLTKLKNFLSNPEISKTALEWITVIISYKFFILNSKN